MEAKIQCTCSKKSTHSKWAKKTPIREIPKKTPTECTVFLAHAKMGVFLANSRIGIFLARSLKNGCFVFSTHPVVSIHVRSAQFFYKKCHFVKEIYEAKQRARERDRRAC